MSFVESQYKDVISTLDKSKFWGLSSIHKSLFHLMYGEVLDNVPLGVFYVYYTINISILQVQFLS